jgi:hypothetical protein
MAKTEITKILFRRGEEKHRRSLFTYGGLDNGEPGWTSVSEKAASIHLTSYGINPTFPDLSKDEYTGAATKGLPPERPAGQNTQCGKDGSNPQGLCDLWIGGGKSEEDDIYIGGQSAEYYNQMRFVSLSGTDLNHPKPYIQGNFTVGTANVPYKFQQHGNVQVGLAGEGYQTKLHSPVATKWLKWEGNILDIQGDVNIGDAGGAGRGQNVNIYSNDSSKFINWDATSGLLKVGAAGGNAGLDLTLYSDLDGGNTDKQRVVWDQTCAVLSIATSTALKLPVGVTDDRPGNHLGTNSACPSAIGMVRYNSSLMSFEGLQGTDTNQPTLGVWSSLGGLMSKDRCTYMTPEVPSAPDGNGNKLGTAHTLTFVTSCTEAGHIDATNNLFINGDIVAFNSSDERQKGNIRVIDSPMSKLYKIKGVTFDWNNNCSIMYNIGKSDIGVIAQDVEKVIPDAVKTRDDGFMGVDYNKLVPLLVEAVKELSDRVKELEGK